MSPSTIPSTIFTVLNGSPDSCRPALGLPLLPPAEVRHLFVVVFLMRSASAAAIQSQDGPGNFVQGVPCCGRGSLARSTSQHTRWQASLHDTAVPAGALVWGGYRGDHHYGCRAGKDRAGAVDEGIISENVRTVDHKRAT